MVSGGGPLPASRTSRRRSSWDRNNDAVPEGIVLDLDGTPRFLDDFGTPDTGNPGAAGPPVVDMGAYEFALAATAWRSMRGHEDLGERGIGLEAAAEAEDGDDPAVEARNGRIAKIAVDLNQPVQLIGAVSVTGVAHDKGTPLPPVAYTPRSVNLINDDTTLEINFDPGDLPDETCYLIDLAGALEDLAGQARFSDADCMVQSLVGDLNGDGYTNRADMAFVKSGAARTFSPTTSGST